MARIRSIKPEFWTAEQIMELSRDARLLFVGLWNFCDDAGIHPAKVKTLKAEVFPSDDLTSTDVRRMIDELIAEQLVVEYEVDGESYWQVTGWHHQKIDQPTYKHPSPNGKVPTGAAKRRSEKPKESNPHQENSPNTRRTFAEHSQNTSRTFAECSPPESSRVESKGEEVNPSLSTREAAETFQPYKPTRKGTVCGLLRKAGMSDAAPHYLTDEVWDSILSKRTDEEIVEVAKAKMASKPNQRIGLKYIAKALLEDPAQTPINGPPHRNGKPEKFDPVAYVNRNRISTQRSGNAPDNETIDITPERVD